MDYWTGRNLIKETKSLVEVKLHVLPKLIAKATLGAHETSYSYSDLRAFSLNCSCICLIRSSLVSN